MPTPGCQFRVEQHSNMATAPVETIADAEAFGQYLDKSEAVLVVMDCHQQWCGPCDTMKPTYNSIFNEIKNCEEKVAFTTCAIDAFMPQLTELMTTKASDLDLANHGCMPFFLLVKNREVQAVVLGADVPTLRDNVVLFAPEDEAAE